MQTTVQAGPPIPPGGALPKLEASEHMRPAGFWIRFLAWVIDYFILALLMTPLSLLLQVLPQFLLLSPGSEGLSGNAVVWVALAAFGYVAISFAIQWIYFGWFYKHRGASLGKMLLKLRVVDHQTGQNIGWGKTFLREIFGKILSAFVLLIGFLMAGFRDDKRALHDLIAGTQVLQKTG